MNVNFPRETAVIDGVLGDCLWLVVGWLGPGDSSGSVVDMHVMVAYLSTDT